MATKKVSASLSNVNSLQDSLLNSSNIDWSQYIDSSTMTTSGNGIYNGYTNFVNLDIENAKLEDFIVYFKEEELIELLDRVLGVADEKEFTKLVRTIVRARHFSEEFLSKYLQYLRKRDILKMHESDLKSGSYATICLYFETKEDKGDDDGPFGSFYSTLGA